MKNVVCVLGSPRKKGNSQALAAKVLETCEQMGATGQSFSLYQMDFRGCIACLGCKKGAEECVLRDDLTPLLRAMKDADILVLASPIYFGDITGVMKCFVDRMYSLMTPEYLTGGNPTRLAPGKKLLFILTQGYPGDDRFAEAKAIYGGFLGPGWFGYELHWLWGRGLNQPTDAAESAELIGQAEALAKQLMA
jgi:multimeric flavodoxin WrbA